MVEEKLMENREFEKPEKKVEKETTIQLREIFMNRRRMCSGGPFYKAETCILADIIRLFPDGTESLSLLLQERNLLDPEELMNAFEEYEPDLAQSVKKISAGLTIG